MSARTLARLALMLAVIALFLALALLTATYAGASVTGFEVVVSGDSIIRLSETKVAGEGRYVDAEDGRQVALRGTSDRLSSTEAVRLMVPMVKPGGTFVFQDNAAQTTPAQWRALLVDIVQRLPDDRCLLGVLPVWVAPGSPATIADAAVKANIMVAEFAKQPCHDWVRWNQAVTANPALVYDGQHPTSAGTDYLAAQITARTGHVITAGSCTV